MKASPTENALSTKSSITPKVFWAGDSTIYLFLVGMVVGLWQFSRFGICSGAEELGYRIGLAVAS